MKNEQVRLTWMKNNYPMGNSQRIDQTQTIHQAYVEKFEKELKPIFFPPKREKKVNVRRKLTF